MDSTVILAQPGRDCVIPEGWVWWSGRRPTVSDKEAAGMPVGADEIQVWAPDGPDGEVWVILRLRLARRILDRWTPYPIPANADHVIPLLDHIRDRIPPAGKPVWLNLHGTRVGSADWAARVDVAPDELIAQLVDAGDDRIYRAAAGTPVPDGWRVVTHVGDMPGERIAWTAPAGLDGDRARAVWADHRVIPDRLRTAQVWQDAHGEWAFGSHHGDMWGRARMREEALRRADERLSEEQQRAWETGRRVCGGRLDWTGWPDQPPAGEIRVRQMSAV